jgi:hypothetical protein
LQRRDAARDEQGCRCKQAAKRGDVYAGSHREAR